MSTSIDRALADHETTTDMLAKSTPHTDEPSYPNEVL